jgi:asparagine synthase (glutamine-hydrolysing)
MCGISGIYNFLNKDINSKKIIDKIIKIQHRRGPDGNGIWKSNCNKITFGHNRLSIIDLSEKANQPFISNDNNLIITFNGEIYNYKQLKNELEKNNVIFKSNSDTEVIIESYKFWGLEFLKKLRGMFSFAIWDDLNKKLIIVRDPFGIKPIYYTKINGAIYFASQIKSILSIDNLKFDLSDAGIVSYYLWGNVQEPFTLYKDIKSLKKGNCLVIDDRGNESIINYADIKNSILNTEKINFKDENEKLAYLNDAIQETVNFHQVSDVPRTLLLSSGVDSNLILGSINENNKKNCSALTLDFKYTGNEDETVLAKKSANMNNIKHQISEISPDEFFLLIENFYKDMDSPTNDGFNNYLISYLAKKQNSKIIISGVGGDEIFFSYPSFNIIPKLNKNLKYLPKFNFLNSFFKNTLYSFLKKKKLKTKYSGLIEYGQDINSAFLLIRSLFLPFEIKEVIGEKTFIKGYEELNTINSLSKDIQEINDTRLSIMYLEIKYYLCSKLLRDSDWVSMSHSIELRTPFVDWSFFNKLIPIIKGDKNFNKFTALNSMKNKLPKELISRKKTGFVIPHNDYLEKLSVTRKFANPIRDWSTFSYERYMQNVL